jgi:predicted Zn finger-like uncharacterized protein
MILTCPACDTKYVVKDDAIPPGGRQVRCASCKHSWHQDAEMATAEPATAADIDFGGPPTPEPDAIDQPSAEVPPQAEAVDNIAGEPQPEMAEESPWGAVATEPVDFSLPPTETAEAEEVAVENAPAVADESPDQQLVDQAPEAAEEEFVGYAPITDEHAAPRRRWSLLLGVILLIAVAAAAFWFFAPAEWKERAGIAQVGATPLQLMITTSDRQPLQSGNELVAISGRVINPTDREQNVPPIRAELRDKQTKQVVHRWTIPPPARVLAPRSSASFNSAEVDVPKGGDELTVTLGS